jgi:hypothetical protein
MIDEKTATEPGWLGGIARRVGVTVRTVSSESAVDDGQGGLRPLRYLLLAFIALQLWSEFDAAQWEPISSHISNFAATGVLCVVLLSLPPIRRLSLPVRVASVGLSVALVSTLLELRYARSPIVSADPGTTFFRFYNTPDPLDAVFGIASILLTMSVLLWSNWAGVGGRSAARHGVN